jgi:hypothetical protein
VRKASEKVSRGVWQGRGGVCVGVVRSGGGALWWAFGPFGIIAVSSVSRVACACEAVEWVITQIPPYGKAMCSGRGSGAGTAMW